MRINTQHATQGDIWTGQLDRLPNTPVDESLICQPTWQLFEAGRVVLVDAIGILDHKSWLRLALTINEAADSGAASLVLRFSSDAQVARGVGNAIAAIEAAGRQMATIAQLDGVSGAALAGGASCQKVFCGEGEKLGPCATAIRYGHGRGLPAADDISFLLNAIIGKRELGLAELSYPQIAGQIVNAGSMSREKMRTVFNHLNQAEAQS